MTFIILFIESKHCFEFRYFNNNDCLLVRMSQADVKSIVYCRHTLWWLSSRRSLFSWLSWSSTGDDKHSSVLRILVVFSLSPTSHSGKRIQSSIFFVSVANIKVTFKISHLVCLRLLRQEKSQDDRHQWPATTKLILIMPAPDHGQSLITEVNRKLLVSIYLAVSPGLDTWYCLTAQNYRRIFLVIRCCYVDLTQRSFEIIFIL